jgi:hypothetical protein
MHGFAASKVSHTISLVSLFLYGTSTCFLILCYDYDLWYNTLSWSLVISKSFHPYMAE